MPKTDSGMSQKYNCPYRRYQRNEKFPFLWGILFLNWSGLTQLTAITSARFYIRLYKNS